MNQTELKHFVTEWMLSQDKDMEFAPDENGYVMFRRGACSINIAAYFQMILEDFLEAQAIDSYKGSNTEIGETNFPLKIWANIYNPIKPDSWDLYVTEKAAVTSSIGAKTHCYIHESISQQPLPTPPQTKTI